MTKEKELRAKLERYDSLNCPDNYYEAWLILFTYYNPANKDQILNLAVSDMEEEESLRLEHRFNKNRRKISGIGERKYNWY